MEYVPAGAQGLPRLAYPAENLQGVPVLPGRLSENVRLKLRSLGMHGGAGKTLQAFPNDLSKGGAVLAVRLQKYLAGLQPIVFQGRGGVLGF